MIVKKKAVNKDPYKWGRVKKLYNYYDRQFLESHKSIFDVGDAVLYYNKVGITSDKSCVYWLNPKYNSVSETYLKPKQDNTTNLDTKIAFVVNGLLVDRQISDILDGASTWSVSSFEATGMPHAPAQGTLPYACGCGGCQPHYIFIFKNRGSKINNQL